MTCRWVAPPIAPLFLPWLAILALLAFKPNRCAAAWWIWAPLAIVAGVAGLPLQALPSQISSAFLDVILALAFGLATVWLLAIRLGRPHRFLTRFVSILPILALSAALVLASRHGLDREGIELLPISIMTTACIVLAPATLFLSARVCRRKYRRLKFTVSLAVFLMLAWAAFIVPFALIASGGRVPITELAIPILIMAGVSFGTLLPFLILSFASPFYHERLKLLLRLGASPLPSLTTPTPPPDTVPESG